MGKKKNWKKVQFIVPDLALEVTRRCNMACEHCLRGEAQNCDIDFKVINKATKFVSPSSVVFTGGEPSLNTMAIDYYFKRCEVNDNVPESFYVVTNGLDKNNMKRLTFSLLNAYSCIVKHDGYFDEDNLCGVAVSRDKFHDKYRGIGHSHDWDILQGLSFYRPEDKFHEKSSSNNWLINTGRAEKNHIGTGCKYFANLDLNEYIDDMVIEGDVLYVYLNDIMYISAKGLVTNCCDLSYADIDSQNFGNLDEFVKKCEDYYLNSKTFGR